MNSVNVQSYGLLEQSALRCVLHGDVCKCVGLWTLSTELTMHTHAGVIQARSVYVWDCGRF